MGWLCRKENYRKLSFYRQSKGKVWSGDLLPYSESPLVLFECDNTDNTDLFLQLTWNLPGGKSEGRGVSLPNLAFYNPEMIDNLVVEKNLLDSDVVIIGFQDLGKKLRDRITKLQNITSKLKSGEFMY
ncbi:unnamed protein product [marine sediment metagenome]|uniref:Uncharacterized protein n=1 Tax=marine sediment metagenome TaxID=412755 RepID=X1U1H5_9ZZZZ